MAAYPGRISFVDLAELRHVPVADGVTFERGAICTTNAAGYLIPAPDDEARAQRLTNGFFVAVQGMTTPAATAGEVKVQVAVARSRISVLAGAGIAAGNKVVLSENSNRKVEKAQATDSYDSIIGTYFDQDETGRGKVLTDDGDIIVIEVGI